MAGLSIVLANICIFDSEFPVDCDCEPVQDAHGIRGIFSVHGPGLMPDHFFAQLFNQLLYFGAGKLGGYHKVIQVIGRPEESLGRGETKVFGEEDKIHHETVSEFTGHTHRLGQ
jgi:hypothetical protein